MKLFSCLGLFLLLAVSESYACMPEHPSASQHRNLLRVLESEAFKEELRQQTEQDHSVKISSIQVKDPFDVTLSNHCIIISEIMLEKPDHGSCPRFMGVRSNTICPR